MVATHDLTSATRYLGLCLALVSLLACGCAEMPRNAAPVRDRSQPCCERQQIYDLFAAPNRLGH